MQYTNDAIKRRINNTQKIKKILTIIVYIMLIPMLTYNVLLIGQSIINPHKTPSFLGIKTYVIISGSMEPELQIGDIVITKNIKEEELKVGDIISFRQGQSVVTHRISAIVEENEKKYYKTKGDSNNAEDSGNINYDLIEGKVVNTIPKIGNIVLVLQGKVAILFLIICIYIDIVFSGNMKRKKNLRKTKRLEYEKRKKIAK